MKAITQDRYGGPEVLQYTEQPTPKINPSEVLVDVHAAGVNPVDWKLGAGGLDPLLETHFPLIPGWDVAGTVTATGLDAGEFAVGDEVYGYVRKDWAEKGAYAEQVSADTRMLARKPRSLSWEQAAGVPLAGLTAYQSLHRVRVGSGETVLVHAAAGGVGSFAVQIAVAWGARVIGTASERNHDYLRGLGAEPVSYGDGLAERVRELAPNGIDAAVDFVGGGTVELSQQLARNSERVVSVADQEAPSKGAHLVWVRPSSAGLAALAELADAGKLAVNVEQTLPLSQAAEAWHISQQGRTRGKLVLQVR